MDLQVRFRRWMRDEIGSCAAPALRQHLRAHDYRLYSYVEHDGSWQRDVYHPERGFFRAFGGNDEEALQGILRQIWLVDAFQPGGGREVRPPADR